jgi:hypothetical protein
LLVNERERRGNLMDQKTYFLIELTLFTGGSVHVYDKRGDLLLVIASDPATD